MKIAQLLFCFFLSAFLCSHRPATGHFCEARHLLLVTLFTLLEK